MPLLNTPLNSPLNTPLAEKTAQLLQRMTLNLQRQTLPHAHLFHGLDATSTAPFLMKLSQILLCQRLDGEPCQQCQGCELVRVQGHPDLVEIKPEKKTSPIKIDVIRELNQYSYLTPQLGGRRVVLIHQAEKLNVASSNALLKLLEEPPREVYFILQVSHLSTLLPTLLSRCQLWSVSDEASAQFTLHDLINGVVAANADADADLAKVIADVPRIVTELVQVVVERRAVTSIATRWLDYDLTALLDILYWINSDCVKRLAGQHGTLVALEPLIAHVNGQILFSQLDKLNQVMQRMHASIAVNALLMLEDYLLGFVVRI